MYQDYFAFSDPPFSIAPDPRYLYMSGQHQEALAHLLYGVEGNGGFVLLTGEVGTGKTTVCRCLLEKLPPACDVAFIYNPRLTEEELLATICTEFGIAVPAGTTSIKVYVDHINAYLLDAHARGRKSVLIIDEAQNLSTAVLEELRLLTNLETHERKLLQIVLLGQPELQDLLAKPELRQVASRIIARYHLRPLDRHEVAAYVNHRITVAGSGRRLFPAATLRQLSRLSKGVPRVINLLCDRALLGAYVQGQDRVDRATLAKAASEVFGRRPARRKRVFFVSAATVAGLAAATALGIGWFQHQRRQAPQAITARTLAPLASTEPALPPPTVDGQLPKPTVATAPAVPLEVAAPASTPGAPALPDWPRGAAKAGSEAAAYAAVMKLWGADYAGAGTPCEVAQKNQLRCLIERGGLDELRRLNVPAVLSLRDVDGPFFMALTGIDDAAARFITAEGIRQAPLAALAERWSGDYVLLWRPPAGYRGQRAITAGSAASAWLAQAIAKVQGGAVSEAELPAHIKAFQLAEGLQPDGMAGPKTLIRLIARTDANAPRLGK